MRVQFCGVIEGSVTLRPGETHDEAILRAERAILDVLDRYARRYGRERGEGPVIGLEPA